MIVYKIAGALILSLSGICCAVCLNRNVERRPREAAGWIALLRFCKVQVECFSLPMGEILARSDPEVLSACGYEGGLPPGSFEELLAASRLYDSEVERIARGFCEEFGRGYREEQMRGCEYYLSELEEHRRMLVGKLPAQKKMNTTLSVCAALAVVLLLV